MKLSRLNLRTNGRAVRNFELSRAKFNLNIINTKTHEVNEEMFQTNLLKSALVACSLLEAIKAVTTSNADLAAFPSFEAAMANAGSYMQWESYRVTSGSGYNLTMFKLIGDSLGNPL